MTDGQRLHQAMRSMQTKIFQDAGDRKWEDLNRAEKIQFEELARRYETSKLPCNCGSPEAHYSDCQTIIHDRIKIGDIW